MTEHAAIGFWVQAPGQKGFDIHVSADLTDDEFNRYLGAIASYRAMVQRSTYELLLRDRHRLQSMQAMYANLERVGGSFRAVDTRTVAALFMGEVTHWLAATRLYLESERDSMARRFGDTSAQVLRFAGATSRVFDTIEGYRFLYNLRDYSQHCGPPLGGLTVASLPDGSQSVELYVSRSDLLLARFRWSRHAKELLEQWDVQILLMPLIEQAMSGFREIEDEVLAILIEGCGDALPTLREAIHRSAVEDGGHASIFRLPPHGGDGEVAWQTLPPSSGLDQLESALRAKSPVAALRKPFADPLSQRPPELRHAEAQAAAVIGAWLEQGPGEHLTNVINRVLDDDADVEPLISGLVNLSTHLLEMLSISLGSTSEALLGGFLASERPKFNDDDEASSSGGGVAGP